MSVRKVGVGVERRGFENRVRAEAGKENERGWCPRTSDRRVVLPEPAQVSSTHRVADPPLAPCRCHFSPGRMLHEISLRTCRQHPVCKKRTYRPSALAVRYRNVVERNDRLGRAGHCVYFGLVLLDPSVSNGVLALYPLVLGAHPHIPLLDLAHIRHPLWYVCRTFAPQHESYTNIAPRIEFSKSMRDLGPRADIESGHRVLE